MFPQRSLSQLWHMHERHSIAGVTLEEIKGVNIGRCYLGLFEIHRLRYDSGNEGEFRSW